MKYFFYVCKKYKKVNTDFNTAIHLLRGGEVEKGLEMLEQSDLSTAKKNIAKAEMNGEVPLYNEALVRVAIRLAAVYVQNQQELDITQDKGLLADFQQAILAAIGGAPSGNT